MAEALWNMALKGLKPDEERAAFLLFCTWAPYIIGGVVGATLAPLTSWSLTPVAALYGAGMYSMQVEPPKKAKKEEPKKPAAAATVAAGDAVTRTSMSAAANDVEMGCKAVAPAVEAGVVVLEGK